MNIKRPPRIFVSYARSDGEEAASTIRKRLTNEYGFALWQDLTEMEGGKNWWQQIVEAIKQVEYLILVMTPGALRSDIVRKEWQLARQEGVCVIPVMGAWLLDFSIFPLWMRCVHFVRIDETEQWTRFIRTLESPCVLPRVPLMVDDLPEDLVERPKEFDLLISYLLDEKREEPVAIAATLQGAGGYGKTTLAKVLCHDEHVQNAFHDGILWVTLGQDPGNLTERVEDLCYILSGKRTGFYSIEAATSHFVELLADRSILIVIDDVWKATDLKPFMQGGPFCARLITTRNNLTLPLNSRQVQVDAMQPDEADKLLRHGLSNGSVDELKKLSIRLGKWPLLLKLVNAALRDLVNRARQPLQDSVAYVNKALDKRGLIAFDAENPIDRDKAVEKTLSLSLELLREGERQRLEELAIFPEDVEIPLVIVEKLWRATAELDEFETLELCRRLKSLSLLLDLDLTKRFIRLHDVISFYFQSKRIEMLPTLHTRLLNAYHLEDWSNLRKDDLYLWHYLAYHLSAARRNNELRKILLDFKWLNTKLSVTNVHELISDYDFLSHDVESKLIQSAIRLSGHVLAQDKSQLASQLLGRLLSINIPAIKVMLSNAQLWNGSYWLQPLTASLTPPGGRLIVTLHGHTDTVNTVAVDPCGKFAISASKDSTLKVWDLENGKELFSLIGHSETFTGITAVTITPDGKKVVSASGDQTLKVWDLETGKKLITFSGHSEPINNVIVTADGSKAISVSAHEMKIWSLESGIELYALTEHPYLCGMSAKLSADGAKAIFRSEDETLKVWDIENKLETLTLKGKLKNTESFLMITPDGQKAISSMVSVDPTFKTDKLKVWDLNSGEELFSLVGHSKSVCCVVATPDSTKVISGSYDCTLRLWDLNTGNELFTFKGHGAGVHAVAVTPDGSKAISASYDNSLKVWDLDTGRELFSLKGHSHWVEAVAVTYDGKKAISVSHDHTLKVWMIDTTDRQISLHDDTRYVKTAFVTRDGRKAILSLDNNTCEIWNLEIVKKQYSISKIPHSFHLLTITHDGNRAIVDLGDGILNVWDIESGNNFFSLGKRALSGSKIVITPDSKKAIITYDHGKFARDNEIKVWDIIKGAELFSIPSHNYYMHGVSVTPDGTAAIVGLASSIVGGDHIIKMWSMVTGDELFNFKGHSKGVEVVAIAPDGQRAVSGSWDHTLKVWNLKTRSEIFTLKGHTDCVHIVSITSDCRKVISTASKDSNIKVWDINTGEEIFTLYGHSDRISTIVVTSDSKKAISASIDQTIRVWNLENGKLMTSFFADSAVASCAIGINGRILIAREYSGKVHFLRFNEF